MCARDPGHKSTASLRKPPGLTFAVLQPLWIIRGSNHISALGVWFIVRHDIFFSSHLSLPILEICMCAPTSTFTNTRSGVPICAQARALLDVHRGTSDAALPKIFAQDHESLNQRSLWAGQPKEVMISINSTSATILPRKQLFLRQQLPPKLNFACSVDHNVNLDRIWGSGSSHTQRC